MEFPSPVGASAPEGVNGASASHWFTTVPEPFRDEIFLASFSWNALPFNDEGIAALDDYHVFIVVMHMRHRHRSLATGPERHLAPIRSVKYVTCDSRCRLTAGRDPICRTLHEVWEIVHGRSFCSAPINLFYPHPGGKPCCSRAQPLA